MFLWYPVLDLARAPRRTARKKGSGYENGKVLYERRASPPALGLGEISLSDEARSRQVGRAE